MESKQEQMSPQEKEIRERYNFQYDTVTHRCVALVGLGLCVASGTLGLATINAFTNPCRETEVVRSYNSMNETLNILKSDRANLLRNDGLVPSYVPESAKNEFNVIYGSSVLDRFFALDSYIAKVKLDIESVVEEPLFRGYRSWNDAHFTFDDRSFWMTFGAGNLLSGLSGLAGVGRISRIRKKESEELKQLEVQSA